MGTGVQRTVSNVLPGARQPSMQPQLPTLPRLPVVPGLPGGMPPALQARSPASPGLPGAQQSAPQPRLPGLPRLPGGQQPAAQPRPIMLPGLPPQPSLPPVRQGRIGPAALPPLPDLAAVQDGVADGVQAATGAVNRTAAGLANSARSLVNQAGEVLRGGRGGSQQPGLAFPPILTRPGTAWSREAAMSGEAAPALGFQKAATLGPALAPAQGPAPALAPAPLPAMAPAPMQAQPPISFSLQNIVNATQQIINATGKVSHQQACLFETPTMYRCPN